MLKRALLSFLIVAVHAAPASGATRTIVVLGDSLSSGYGLGSAKSWVAILEDQLAAEAYGYDVVNASIPGDTSAGGLSRLPRLLENYSPDIVIVELGGNDGLLGQPTANLRQNLSQIVELVVAAGARPVLMGIQLPPNFGLAYTEQFATVYRELARNYELVLVDFSREGVALTPEMMQSDRIHPNAAGQKPMFDNVWKELVELL